MLTHSMTIMDALKCCLKDGNISCRVQDRLGTLTFSAASEYDGEAFLHHINVSIGDLWVTVQVPAEVPDADKVVTRMAKFCCRVNLSDNTGGFLVLDIKEGRLLYRMRIACGETDIYRTLEARLPLAAGRVSHYMCVIPLLVKGKISVEEAVKKLDRQNPFHTIPRLVTPRPKQERPDAAVLEERRRLLGTAIEAYLREKPEQAET